MIRKLSTRWKKLKVGEKGAVIGGIFVLTAACCTVTGVIANTLINYFLSSIPPITRETYPLRSNGLYTSPALLYSTMYEENDSGVVPTKCVQVNYEDRSVEQILEKSVLKDAQSQSFAFDLVTDQSLIITNAEVILQDYLPPPKDETIKGVTYYDPIGGMGNVPPIFLI